MLKKIWLFATTLLILLVCITACNTSTTPPLETDGESDHSSDTVTQTETIPPETEPETQAETSPYAIPDPTRIDLRTFTAEQFKESFNRGNSSTPKQCDEGVKFVSRGESRDPSVVWQMSDMYQAAGYPPSADGETYVPFTPEEKKVIVFKIKSEYGGAFELFYATEDRTGAQSRYAMTEIYQGDAEFFGESVWQYIIFEADANTNGWKTRFNNGFRLDYSNFVLGNDEFFLQKIAICADRAEAEAFISQDKGEMPTPPAVEKGFYVCLYEDRLAYPENNVLGGDVFDTKEAAISRCNRNKEYGYRVANEKGEVVYTPYSLLVSNLLREGNWVTTYAREQKFKYGDSPTNPAINHRPHRTSCDRLVDWILYRAGFTDQPLVQGKVVSNLEEWCRRMGFEKITNVRDLQAGDVILVRPASDGGPQHTFILASDYQRNGQALRYDHGSDARIMSHQPSNEPISYPDAAFIVAYRPVATAQNNSLYQEIYAE